MSDVGIEPEGEEVWRWIVHDIGAMLLQLLGEPAAKVADHEEIPSGPGVYLFSKDGRAVMLGLADDLRRDLHAAVSPDAEGGSTYLSFHLARWMARKEGVDVGGEPSHPEAGRAFAPHYSRAKELVPHLSVRFIRHRDLLERQVLALYSEVHLNAAIPSRLHPQRDDQAFVGKLPFRGQDPPPAETLTTVVGVGSLAVAREDASARLGREEADELVPAEQPSPAQLGWAIRQIRRERGLTQEQVADRAFLTEGYFNFIETGSRTPTWKALTEISAALGVSTAALVARAEES